MKIVETKKGCACSDSSLWKCQRKNVIGGLKRSDAKDHIVGNCEGIEENVGNVKKRSFC